MIVWYAGSGYRPVIAASTTGVPLVSEYVPLIPVIPKTPPPSEVAVRMPEASTPLPVMVKSNVSANAAGVTAMAVANASKATENSFINFIF